MCNFEYDLLLECYCAYMQVLVTDGGDIEAHEGQSPIHTFKVQSHTCGLTHRLPSLLTRIYAVRSEAFRHSNGKKQDR